jgi:cold shock CspA family protein
VTVGGWLVGTVTSFDAAVGLGEVEPAAEPGHAGGRVGREQATRYRFHCTQIANGTRRIEAGEVVSFRLLPGRDGQWEAADLQPVSAAWSPESAWAEGPPSA